MTFIVKNAGVLLKKSVIYHKTNPAFISQSADCLPWIGRSVEARQPDDLCSIRSRPAFVSCRFSGFVRPTFVAPILLPAPQRSCAPTRFREDAIRPALSRIAFVFDLARRRCRVYNLLTAVEIH
jgi:hypothetical protein